MKKNWKRFFKPGWIVVYLIILWLLISMMSTGKIIFDQTVRLEQGETIAKIYNGLGWADRLRMKRYFRKHTEEIAGIQPGAYVFSGKYSPEEVLDIFLAGPQVVYEHITLLEGWSSYDTDASLTEKGLIDTGAYRSFVTDSTIIERYVDRFAFLAQAQADRGQLLSLEGYLYPDTYYIDISKDVVDQLVYLQLENFQKRVREPYGDQLTNLTNDLRSKGYSFTLSTYGAMTLASIIEKEERADSQRPSVASVFYNRLQDGMRIDADISLCYGLNQPYSACTPQVIVQHLTDSNNLYNTRALGGLPPTPIGNPTVSSVKALLTAEKGPYYYYLHDSDGQLHLGRDISEHNNNKSKYLN